MQISRQNRRGFLAASSVALVSSSLQPKSKAAVRINTSNKQLVIGQMEAAEVGKEVLTQGGNAIDAIVAAALVAGVVAIPSTGIGGYGGHLVDRSR